MHTCDVTRATEELQLLAQERERCAAYLQNQEQAIRAAVQGTQDRLAALQMGAGAVPACSSEYSHQPQCASERAREQQYCEGLLVLLGDRLCAATMQAEAARAAFSSAEWAAAAAACSGTPDQYYSEEEDPM